ncbi:MAG TPA: ABC transporter permease [Candidatus Sulfotelmatobacter sp.]|nr:ABC transporter permease [Candidatus Sulfotelmatobacter sp.]
MNGILQDVRYALRQLRKNGGFTIAAVLVLGLGLGISTGMLAVVRSVLINPLPYPHSEQIVELGTASQTNAASVSYPDLQEMQHSLHAFNQLAAYMWIFAPVQSGDGTRMSNAVAVTTNLFTLLQVQPVMGRTFRQDDNYAAVIDRDFWLHSLHGKADVLGSKLKVNGDFYTVVGVMPSGVQFPWPNGDIWTTLQLSAEHKNKEGFDQFNLVGRLNSGVGIEQARQELQSFWQHKRGTQKSEPVHPWVYPFLKIVTGDERPAMLALLGACLVLLLIALVNASNLQLARGARRKAEIAMRAALGATRARLMRQMIVESVVISLVGAAGGWILATGFVRTARNLFQGYPRIEEARLDPWTFLACLVLAVICGVVAAFAPSWHLLRARSGFSLEYRGAERAARPQRLSGGLVATEVALTCVLLVTAGLFLRTLRSLEHVHLGFAPERLTTFQLWAQGATTDKEAIFSYEQALERIQALPGVEAVGMTNALPIGFFIGMSERFGIPGHLPIQQKGGPEVRVLVTTPGYFSALRIPLLAGRFLSGGDRQGSEVAGVVNEVFVSKYLRGVDPIGKQIVLEPEGGFSAPVTIVGVAGNVVQDNDIAHAILPEVTVSYDQLPPSGSLTHFAAGISASFAVRSNISQDILDRDIRALVAQTAPQLAVGEVTPMRDAVSYYFASKRLAAEIASAFGWTSLLLAAGGLYGVLAYLTALRIREIGIRMALGATRWGVCALVLRQGIWMIGTGTLVGWLAAVLAGRWIRSFLFGVTTHDLPTYALVGLVMLTAAMIAMIAPARRAAKVDPMVALRYE